MAEMPRTSLRCGVCDKPVLLLTAEQAAKVAADPERYAFSCKGCIEPPC